MCGDGFTCMSSIVVSDVKGARPQHHRYRVTPTAHRSTTLPSYEPTASRVHNSGAKKAGVPAVFCALASPSQRQLVPATCHQGR